jgi:hypothetical protein
MDVRTRVVVTAKMLGYSIKVDREVNTRGRDFQVAVVYRPDGRPLYGYPFRDIDTVPVDKMELAVYNESTVILHMLCEYGIDVEQWS